jgi:ATP-binding cassette, subfamily B, bacterial
VQATTIGRLIGLHFRARPARVAALIGLGLVLAGFAVVPPLIIAHVVDRAIAGAISVTAALIALAGIAVLAVWDGLLTLLRRRLAIWNQIDARSRQAGDHFGFCVRLPMREYREGNHAALIRSFDDLDMVVEAVTSTSTEFFANAAIVAGYALLMLFVEPRLALVFFLLAGIGLATSIILTRASRMACEAWLPRRDSRFGYIVECLSQMLTIKTLSAHAFLSRPFAAEQSAEEEAFRAYRKRIALADATNRFWNVAMPGIGAAAGAIMLVAGQVTAGTLVLFLAVSSGLVAALGAMHFQIEQFQEAAAALARMAEVTAGEPERLDDPAADLPPVGAITVSAASFRHPGSAADTLDRVDLDIAPGEHIAIVGPSGEGKTTLAFLLARLHEPHGGAILLNGEPAGNHPLGPYRCRVILVPHVVEVFSASVRDNVRLWDESVPDTQVRGALAAAGLGDLVDGFEAGLDTILGTRGNPLSAGQRQRLGIARALLRFPDVLILDEATSALDSATEENVLRNVRAAMHGGSLVLVTHRENVAASLDRVVRIENGRVNSGNRSGAS